MFKTYLIGVIALSFLLDALSLILPKGKTSKLTECALHLATLLVLFSPVLFLKEEFLKRQEGEWTETSYTAEENYLFSSKELLAEETLRNCFSLDAPVKVTSSIAEVTLKNKDGREEEIQKTLSLLLNLEVVFAYEGE